MDSTVYLNDITQNATTLLFSLGVEDVWTLNLFAIVNLGWLIYFAYRIIKTCTGASRRSFDYAGVRVLLFSILILPLVRLLMITWYLVAYYVPSCAYLEAQVSFWLPATASVINHICLSACLIFLLEKLYDMACHYLVDSDLELHGYTTYAYVLLASNVVVFVAIFTALFYYRPFGQILWFYARSEEDVYPLMIPTGPNKIFHLLMTGFSNVSFCFIAYGLDKLTCATTDLLRYSKLSEVEMDLLRWTKKYCNFVVLYMIGANAIEWLSTYWNYGILSALVLTFYANMFVDFIPIHLILSNINVYDVLHKEITEGAECTSVEAAAYHDESSQSTSDEATA